MLETSDIMAYREILKAVDLSIIASGRYHIANPVAAQ
jgi:hypothetical protein